ncbi:MAG: molecular chaperone DnaK [Candidatus Pacebacteria bacterium]|nr:molecular chaperone DnaK [Candidatus Paceibacterota bacterium]
MSKIIGIDLGTTNSAVAYVEGGQPKIIENNEGNRTTPSIAAIGKNSDRLVGLLAKRQAVTNPTNTIFGVKRYMGHKFSDEAVQKDIKNSPFTIKKGDNDKILIEMNGKDYSPEEISAMILKKIKTDVEEKTGEKVTEAVITVPAYFDDAQRQATKDAGKIAGLEVKRIINEPTAAALAYGFNKKKDEKIVVYDFGGGTFDVSVLEVADDVVEVKSTGGDAHMGGEDIDRAIIDWIGSEYKKDSGIDVTNDVLALQRLKEAAEKAKHELSNTSETEINIPFITSDDTGPKHLLLNLSRAKLEELAAPYLDKSIDITKDVLKSAGFSASDIDEVILVGGQTRMPKIAEMVKEVFGKEPNKSINPDEVVALGAALQGGVLQGDVKDVLLLDVIPLSLSIETMGSVATKLVEKNTTIPASASQVFSTAVDNQTSVEIHIVQGERPMAADNKSLGRFILEGIPPAPRGVPQVEVTFNVDANGILEVSAKDKSTGKENSIRIEGGSKLSDEEIKRMQDEAEEHADEDKKKKELVDVRNMAESMVFSAEKAVKEHGDAVDEETKTKIEDAIKALNEVKAGDDKEAIEKKTAELSESMQKIGEIMQQQAAEEAKASEGTENTDAESSDDGETVDVEAEDSSDDKE